LNSVPPAGAGLLSPRALEGHDPAGEVGDDPAEHKVDEGLKELSSFAKVEHDNHW
jgi:hypothetical protein